MSPRNYFKANKHEFFFSPGVPESIQGAYDAARLVDANVSVFKPVKANGPWSSCPVIGHRPLDEIRRDLHAGGTDEEDTLRLEDEYTALLAVYGEAQAIAA